MFKRWLRNSTIAMALAFTPLPAFAQDTIKQGGDIVITYKDDIATLDPAIGYDWVNWSMIKSLYSRLMDYTPGTPDLIPSLAESFTVSPDGLTYTFKLRKGVKFTNGREVAASDVKYSIERAVDPKTQGPGAGFFGAIKGFDAVSGGTSPTMEASRRRTIPPSSSRCRAPTPPSCMFSPSTRLRRAERSRRGGQAAISARTPWVRARSC